MSLASKLSAIKKTVENRESQKKSHDELISEIRGQKQLLEKLVDSIKEVDKSVSIKEYPDKIEVSNFPQQKAVEVKKPSWLKQFSLNDLLSSLADMLSAFGSRRFNVNLDEYKTSKNAISVRLSDGKTFINQLATAVGMAGGGRDRISVENLGEISFPDVGINLPEWDSVVATYPTTSTEVYTFTFDSVEVATVTATYTDETKEVFTSAVVSKP